MEPNSQCAKCPYIFNQRICRVPNGQHPDFCATVHQQQILSQAKALYEEPETYRFAHKAAVQEASKEKNGIPCKPRIVEIVEFCKRMGYQHIGLAFCGGLRKEAKAFNDILELNGLTVTSVICKVDGMDPDCLGMPCPEGVSKSLCNPIGQAAILNAAHTEFNVVLGLCVGHDSLFLANSDAMCTILAVKDRVFGHSPLTPIYQLDNSYRYLKKPLEIENLDD